MKKTKFISLSIFIFFSIVFQTTYAKSKNNQLTKAEKEAGWVLIWDGKTPNGWQSIKSDSFPTKAWTIENGVLSVNKNGDANGSDIVTKKAFKNFILEAEFNYTPKANSGIKYFIQKNNDGTYSNIGCEFQILDDDLHPDAKMGRDGNRTISSLYDLIPANGKTYDQAQPVKQNNGPNQWNRARIEVRGDKVSHFLNGVKVVEYTRRTQQWRDLVAASKFADEKGFGDYESGHILLQDHHDFVQFRNIKILELK